MLFACSADPGGNELNRLRSLLSIAESEKAIDWAVVRELAEYHGTSVLLYQNLSCVESLVPATVMAGLRQHCEINIHKSLLLARELFRVLDCAEALGIEVIPYKGVVMSEAYYGDMAMRQSGDIDLFVREQDVARIRNAVKNLGYSVRVPILDAAEKDYIASGYEYTFDSPAGKNLLELQWALQPRYYAVDYEMDGLFARAVNVTAAGRVVKTPAAEDLLLVLSIHAAKHIWGRLIWLCDIARILAGEELNWDWVREQARGYGIERILHITLLLANILLGTRIPVALESRIRSDRAARKFADQIIPTIAARVCYEEQKIAYFRLTMRLRERRVDRMRFLARLTFTPGPGEWDSIRLPKFLFPLYRVVRLGRLAARFGSR